MENELRAARAPEGAARAERTDGIEETAGIEGTEGTATERTPERTADRTGLATWTGTSKQELGRDFIASLARGLTVLTAFGKGRSALTLSEVARATGLARATARRALITYEHLGLVAARHADRTFAPTPRVLSLGFPALSRSTLPGIAAPHLTRLAGRVHESASMATLTPAGDEIQYTAGALSGRIMSANVTVGSRRPAYATALGRVMLADTPNAEPASGSLPPLTSRTLTSPAALADALRETRELGWSLVDEELEAGLRAIAVPVRDRAGRVVAAVNVALHTASRTTEECVRDILPELRTTATDIESDLHAASHYTHVPLT
jgi:IclR family pca regulon transcriptional regulator